MFRFLLPPDYARILGGAPILILMGYSRLILINHPFLWQHEPVYGIFSKCCVVAPNGSYVPVGPKRATLVKITLSDSNVPKAILCFIIIDFSRIQLFQWPAAKQAIRSLRNRFRAPISIDYRLPLAYLSN